MPLKSHKESLFHREMLLPLTFLWGESLAVDNTADFANAVKTESKTTRRTLTALDTHGHNKHVSSL